MKRTIRIATLLAIVALALSGCSWLFAPRVDNVDPGDLESYTASGTIADTQTSVEDALADGIMGSSGSGGLGAAVMLLMQSTEFQDEIGSAFASFTDGGTLPSILKNFVSEGIEKTRSIVIDGELDDDTSDDEISASINALIENEIVNGSDIGPDGGGTATFNRFFLDGSGSMSVLEYDSEGYPTSMALSGQFDHDADISYDEFTGDGVIIIHSGKINTKGDGKADITVTETDATVSWRLGFALSAGFSFSNTATDEGGKLIVTFSYSGRENVTVNVNDTPEEIADQVSGNIELSLEVKLYDNGDNLVAEYTYTDEDLLGELDTATM